MTIDQVKVIEIGADAIEKVFRDQPLMAMTYPPKLMHAVVAALGRHGYIVEDRYEEEAESLADSVANDPDWPVPPDPTDQKSDWDWGADGRTAPDWDTSGDDM